MREAEQWEMTAAQRERVFRLNNSYRIAAMSVLILSLSGLIVAWVVWAIFRGKRDEHINKEHGFCTVGEHSGWLEYRDAVRVAHIPWERCRGGPLRIALPEARWVWPIATAPTSDERVELQRKFEAWAQARRIHYEVADKLTGLAPPNSYLSKYAEDAASRNAVPPLSQS